MSDRDLRQTVFESGGACMKKDDEDHVLITIHMAIRLDVQWLVVAMTTEMRFLLMESRCRWCR